MPLSHESVGDEDAPLLGFICHGILGSARNWRSFAQRLVECAPDWRLILVDLRCHGDSHGFEPPHTVDACASDLAALERELGRLADAIIGHSFGGKVALRFAANHGDSLRSAWVLDSAPQAISPAPGADTSEVARLIAALHRVELPVASRQAVVRQLRDMGVSHTIAMWMTTNLEPLDEGGFGWRFDLPGIEALLASYYDTDAWPALREPREGIQIDVVRAEQSDLWDFETVERLRDLEPAGQVTLHTLRDSDHWVHIDNPEGLLDLMFGP